MIVSLLHPYKGINNHPVLLANARELCTDLRLDYLFDAMGNGDPFIGDAARRVMLDADPPDNGTLRFRQAVLQDAFGHAAFCNRLYEGLHKTIMAYEKRLAECKPSFARFSPTTGRVRDAVMLCGLLLNGAEHAAGQICSEQTAFGEAFRRFTDSFTRFYEAAFLQEARAQIAALTLFDETASARYGVRLGPGLKGSGYRLYTLRTRREGKIKARGAATIPLDSIGLQAQAAGLLDAGLIKLLRVLNGISAKVLADLKQARFETAFLVGCIHLRERFQRMGQVTCFPDPADGAGPFTFEDLTEAALAVCDGKPPTGNSGDFYGKNLVLITGANQGGKSTFLRSVGLALLMARCGMFVTAARFTARAPGRLFTHFCRDETENSGRLDEELRRMSAIIDQLEPDTLLLMNESFSSTSERDGAGIAREILTALRARGVRTFFVTHLTDYAADLYRNAPEDTAFLRADRQDDGSRRFTLSPGAPRPTGFGTDLYREMFGTGAGAFNRSHPI